MKSSPTHKKVQVVVFVSPHNIEGEAEVLLLQMSPSRGSLWQNVTGNVEEGEEVREAALRELQEETGHALSPSDQLIDLNLHFDFRDRWGRQVKENCYLSLWSSRPTVIQLDSNEHQSYRWEKVSEVTPHSYHYNSNFETFQHACEVYRKLTN